MIPRAGMSLEMITARVSQLHRSVYEQTEPYGHALWVPEAETTLRECFVEIPFERLYTERYWRLTTGPTLRPYEMLRNEQRDQADWLAHILTTMAAMAQRFGTSPSRVAVLDTHVLLHAKSLHLIDWREKLGDGVIRLVVPLRVVDEMDEKKYARRGDLQNRARKRLGLLSRYIAGDVIEMPDHVRVEIVSWRDLDVGGVPRPPTSPDVDILDTCAALRVYAGANEVAIVTGDDGMKLRALDRDLPVVILAAGDMAAGEDT